MSISKGRVLNTTSLVDKVYLFDISSLYSELITPRIIYKYGGGFFFSQKCAFFNSSLTGKRVKTEGENMQQMICLVV